MASLFTLRATAVAASTMLILGGGVALADPALASPASAAQSASGGFLDRGIVCPRGQHAYHAPGGQVSCIPNGQLAPTPPPAPPN